MGAADPLGTGFEYTIHGTDGVPMLRSMQQMTPQGVESVLKPALDKQFRPLQKFFQRTQSAMDQQVLINDRVELLGSLLDYGATFMDALSGFNVSGRMPFNKQIGPMKGVTLLPNGRMRLDSPGQWNLYSQITVDWLPILDPNVTLVSCVRDTRGKEYSVKEVRDASNWVMTLSAFHPVVVPAAGYTVEVEAKFSVLRKVLGGAKYNHLVAQHISSKAGDFDTNVEQINDSDDLQSVLVRPPDTWSEHDWALVSKSSGKSIEELKADARAQGYPIP